MGILRKIVTRTARKAARRLIVNNRKKLVLLLIAAAILKAGAVPVPASPVQDPKVFDVPAYNGLKSYERGIKGNGGILFTQGTKQYQLQSVAETENGFRKVNGRYLVAVGSHFTDKIGQYITLMLDSGIAIPCIVGDQKADGDTDSSNIFTANSCCSEFIVDARTLDGDIKTRGDVSAYRPEWDSPVSSIIVYDVNFFTSAGLTLDETIERLAYEYRQEKGTDEVFLGNTLSQPVPVAPKRKILVVSN